MVHAAVGCGVQMAVLVLLHERKGGLLRTMRVAQLMRTAKGLQQQVQCKYQHHQPRKARLNSVGSK